MRSLKVFSNKKWFIINAKQLTFILSPFFFSFISLFYFVLVIEPWSFYLLDTHSATGLYFSVRTRWEEWLMVSSALGSCEGGSRTRQSLYLRCTCFVDCSWTWFCASCVKHFLQLIRHVYFCWMSDHNYRIKSGEWVCWVLSSVYPESRYGLLSFFCDFPDAI